MLDTTKVNIAIGTILLRISTYFSPGCSLFGFESRNGLRRPRLHLAYQRHRRKIFPEGLQRLYSAKQRGEDRRVGQQDLSGPLCSGRHPNARVEFAVPRFGERMRSLEINRLSRQDVD